MKKSFVIFIVFIVLTGKLSATDHHFLVLESEKTAKLFSFGPGIGIGFFYPKDLNTYIQDYFNDKYSKTVNIDIYEYFLINATASFLFSPYTELQVETEYAVAPKVVLGGDISYAYHRFSPAIKFNGLIPLGKRISYFIGGGISYNLLSFKALDQDFTYKGQTPGFSLQTGVRLHFGKISLEPAINFNFIKADVEDSPTGSSTITPVKELSYTGGQLGCKIFF